MKSFKLKSFISFCLLILCFTAKAGVLIEPLIGYSFGKFQSETTPGGQSDELSIKGASYGGRLGYQNLGFQLGLDYLSSNMSGDDVDLKASELGLFVGFEFPILLRVYAGYVLSGKGSLTGDSEEDDTSFKGGTGPKVGLGITLLPFLDFNIDYRSITYDSEKADGVTFDANYNAIMVGFSLPFVL